MNKSILKRLANLTIGANGATLPFPQFLVSVGPLVLALVWAYVILIQAIFNDVSSYVLIGTTVLPFAFIFSRRSDDTLKAVKEVLGLCWWSWSLAGFCSVFSSLSSGTSISVITIFGGIPLEIQAVTFALFGSTLFAQLGLSAVLAYRQLGDRRRP